jgi:hypothetical protein
MGVEGEEEEDPLLTLRKEVQPPETVVLPAEMEW